MSSGERGGSVSSLHDPGSGGTFAPSLRLDRREAHLVEIHNGQFKLIKVD